MVIKAQDILVALKLSLREPKSSYSEKAADLGMSASEVHAAERRLLEARLLDPHTKEIKHEALLRFLVNGVPYAFAASPKEMTRGIATAWAAPVLADKFAVSTQSPPVWPDPNGTVQGVAVKPLYRSVPTAIKSSPALYELLALVDALRIGRARERKLAEEELKECFKHYARA